MKQEWKWYYREARISFHRLADPDYPYRNKVSGLQVFPTPLWDLACDVAYHQWQERTNPA